MLCPTHGRRFQVLIPFKQVPRSRRTEREIRHRRGLRETWLVVPLFFLLSWWILVRQRLVQYAALALDDVHERQKPRAVTLPGRLHWRFPHVSVSAHRAPHGAVSEFQFHFRQGLVDAVAELDVVWRTRLRLCGRVPLAVLGIPAADQLKLVLLVGFPLDLVQNRVPDFELGPLCTLDQRLPDARLVVLDLLEEEASLLIRGHFLEIFLRIVQELLRLSFVGGRRRR